MVGVAEFLIAVGAIAVIVGAPKKWVKDKWPRAGLVAGGVFVILLGAQMGGYFAALSQATGPAPSAQGVYDAVWDTAASDTDRTETESITTDNKKITYIMADAQMDGLGDVAMGAVLINQNTEGDANSRFAAEVHIVSIGTVIVSGIPTPVANYTADRTRFNIAYTEDAGSGTWTQVHDRFLSYDQRKGESTTLSLDLPIDPAVADDVPAGGSFALAYSVGGITLDVVLSES